MKRPYAVIYLDDLHIRYFDSKEEVSDAVNTSKSVQTIALKYYSVLDGYAVLEQRV